MLKNHPILNRILAFIGAAGALIFATDFVRTHHDDSWRYVEVLPLMIAFSLLLQATKKS